MLYTPMTEAALKLSYEAHAGQTDKAGLPYVFHPFHVAEQMDTEDEICAALLHDVVEDTDRTLDDIRAAGMGNAVIETLGLLTHDPAIPYEDYVAALAANPTARKVKIADLRHNLDKTRIKQPTDRDRQRWVKYERALAYLLKQDRL